LQRREVERLGRDMAGARGLTFLPVQAGEYVSGKLVGSINLASGRFAMIDNGIDSAWCRGRTCSTCASASTSRG
jgi:hypothetical protein